MKDSKIDNLLLTDYIYLPYEDSMNIYIKDKEYIYKNELIVDNEIKKVNSSVSGNVIGVTTIQNKKYIVVENDFKDKLKKRNGSKRDISNYTKEELLKLVLQYSLIKDFNINSKVLIINGIDEYIKEITYSTLLKEYTTIILDTIDALIDIMNIKKCFLAVINKDAEELNILLNNIGTYPKINLRMFNYDFSIGNKYVLINKLTSYKHKNYDVLYLNIKDVLNMYNLLKNNRPLSETFITLTGDLLGYTKVLKVKIGTNLNDILNEYKIDNRNNVIINGLLNGEHINDTNYIIDSNVRSIFINNLLEYKEEDCINCGLCVSSCPLNINPKYKYFNNNKKSEEYRKKCCNCGICSYVCPSKIKLNGVCKHDKK